MTSAMPPYTGVASPLIVKRRRRKLAEEDKLHEQFRLNAKAAKVSLDGLCPLRLQEARCVEQCSNAVASLILDAVTRALPSRANDLPDKLQL